MSYYDPLVLAQLDPTFVTEFPAFLTHTVFDWSYVQSNVVSATATLEVNSFPKRYFS
jgi:hypothetical protein